MSNPVYDIYPNIFSTVVKSGLTLNHKITSIDVFRRKLRPTSDVKKGNTYEWTVVKYEW